MDAGEVWGLLREAINRWHSDNVSRLAAAIAYYTIFSAAPVLVIVIAVASLIYGEAAAKGELVGQLRALIGSDAAGVIQGMVESAGQFRSGMVATVAGVCALVFGATGVFTEIQGALNTIWDIPERGSWKGMLKARLLSFVMILLIGAALLALLIATTALTFIGRLTDSLPGLSYVLDMVNFLLSFAVITVLFAMVFKVLPDSRMAWSDVWAGAAFTSLLFTIGKVLIGFYLASGGMKSTYGAAGSIILLLFWFYFSAQVFLFGAEFTHLYANRRMGKGSHSQEARDGEEGG